MGHGASSPGKAGGRAAQGYGPRFPRGKPGRGCGKRATRTTGPAGGDLDASPGPQAPILGVFPSATPGGGFPAEEN